MLDPLADLRAALVLIQDLAAAHTEQMAQACARASNAVDLLERTRAYVDAREVAHEYKALRDAGRNHDEACAELGVRHERTPRRIESLLRAASALDRVAEAREKKK